MISDITESYVKRGLQLLRAAEGDAQMAASVFSVVTKKIAAAIDKKYGGIKTYSDLNRLSKQIEEDLREFYYVDYPKELHSIAFDVVAAELVWNETTILGAIGKNASDIQLRSDLNRTVASARSKPYQGKTFDNWVKNSFSSKTNQVNAILRKGFKDGIAVAEVASNIKLLTNGASHNIKAITRSFFMHNAVEAKQTAFRAFTDVIVGSIWNSTLDSRTTPHICGVRDQLEYDKEHNPVNHSLPWGDGPGRIHFSCRSIEIPKLKGDNSVATRPSVVAGDDYERGDNKTTRGTTRKPTKAARESGIFDIKQVNTKTNYEIFLKAQSKKNIDYVADILGSMDDARLFRDGKKSLLDLAKESPVFNPTNRNSL